MKRLDKLILEAKALNAHENVTLIYEDGTKKTMSAFSAILSMTNAQEDGLQIIATDQPPGSLIHAIFEGGDLPNDWPQECFE